MSRLESERREEDRSEALAPEQEPEAGQLSEKKGVRALLKSSRGSGTIEKVCMIALFIAVAAAGLMKLGKSTKGALDKQAGTIEKMGGVN
jgi:hypothetical protein